MDGRLALKLQLETRASMAAVDQLPKAAIGAAAAKVRKVRTLILGIIPSLQIVRMTGFHAALRQQNISSCSIINAASARSTKSKGPVWADSVEKQCVAGAESDDPN